MWFPCQPRTSTAGNSASSYGYGGGAGIYNNFGAVMVSSCTLVGNSAGFYGGGGIENDSYGTATVSDSTLSGNIAGEIRNDEKGDGPYRRNWRNRHRGNRADTLAVITYQFGLMGSRLSFVNVT